jgi:hypothetical protein
MANATISFRFPLPVEGDAALSLVNDKRSEFLGALDARMEWERSHAADTEQAQNDLASILEYLAGARVRGRDRSGSNADAFTLAFAIAQGIDFRNVLLSTRVDGACFNVYGIPKMLGIMRVLNGSAFRSDSDDNTTAATVIALSEGHSGGKSMWNRINDLCSTWGMAGGRYGSGATQGGSTLRALAALGIVEKQGAGHFISNKEYFKLLVTAAKKHNK